MMHGQQQNMILKYCVFTVGRKTTKSNWNRPTYKLTVCSSSMFKLISSHYLHLCLSLSRLKMDYMIPSWVNTGHSRCYGAVTAWNPSAPVIDPAGCCGAAESHWASGQVMSLVCLLQLPQMTCGRVALPSGAWLTAQRKQDEARRCSDHLNTICVFM